MDEKVEVIVRRFPYEEPFTLHIEFTASNGNFSGSTDIYCGPGDLEGIGSALRRFPLRIGDEFRFEYGSDNPKDRWYRYFVFRVYTIDGVGHSAIQFVMNNNSLEPFEGASRFSIRADVASINRLGEAFEKFAQLESQEFRWTPRLID
jgi:hypothetical protein